MTNTNPTPSRFLVVASLRDGRTDMSDSHAAPLDDDVDVVLRDLCNGVAIFDEGTPIQYWIVAAMNVGEARLMGPSKRVACCDVCRMIWNG